VLRRTPASVIELIVCGPAGGHGWDMTSIPAVVQAPTSVSPPRGAVRVAAGSDRYGGEMNRSERIGFWLYVAMGAFCMAVLVAAAMTAIVS
jgi:hypothetical protein